MQRSRTWRAKLCLNAIALAATVLLAHSLARAAEPARQPISLHPDNPRYFLFRGKPAILVGSGEHYGSVLNLEFDYERYLDVIQADGLNLTRTFSGYYREVPASFGIRGNTLAPAEGKYSAPWAKDAKGKYDLTKWNDAHFERMRAFVGAAGKRGIVVEMSIFCPFYEDVLWQIDPLNAKNNTRGVGRDVKDRKEVNTLKHADIVKVQEALARKVVTELAEFGNVYFEVCNEPYFGGDDDWQRHMTGVIADAEKDRPHKHLIARNIANGSKVIDHPDERVSVFNFHYCNPPDAVAQNAKLNRPIAYDETGFKGSGDDVYRVRAWQFLLAGGAVFDHLDYSFTTTNPKGTAEVSAPGGGGPAIRAQLALLKRTIEAADFLNMKPDRSIVKGELPKDVTAYVLAEPGKKYLIHLARAEAAKAKGKGAGDLKDPEPGHTTDLSLDLPAGRYRYIWMDPKGSLNPNSPGMIEHPGGAAKFTSPPYTLDVVLELTRSR